jgi:hypothetical protein
MKKFIYKASIFLALITVSISCEDFLDREPVDYSTAGFYQSEVAIENGLQGVYNSLYMATYYSNRPLTAMMDYFTGLAAERTQNTTVGAGGGLTPNTDHIIHFWKGNYLTISRVNALISGSLPYIDGLNDEAKLYIMEARVLRAYAYYNLISTYGDVPFFTEPVTPEQFEDPKTSKVEILDFVLSELDAAAAVLPWIAKSRGHADKAFAMGVKARAALLGGSLNYGGKGADYFKTAAAAAQSVIGNRALAANRDDLFTNPGQTKADVRNETIFEWMHSSLGSIKYNTLAFGAVSRNYGQTGIHPTQMLADTYECIDGLRIDESPLYDVKHPSANRDPRFNATLWMHGDTVVATTSGTTPNVKFVLEAYNKTTMFYNFSKNIWESKTNADIQSAAAWASFANAGLGFITKKYATDTSEPVSKNTFNVPAMRYAEVLLTYAEAKIELNELDASVYDAINQVRNRVGMPNVSADRIGVQNKMRQLVRRERKVELFFEGGLHHVDMRRWQIGDLENAGPCYGYPIALSNDPATGNITSGGYADATPDMIPNFKLTARHDLNDIANYESFKDKLKVRDVNRFWDAKFALWPIPQTELDLNPGLIQNEGY